MVNRRRMVGGTLLIISKGMFGLGSILFHTTMLKSTWTPNLIQIHYHRCNFRFMMSFVFRFCGNTGLPLWCHGALGYNHIQGESPAPRRSQGQRDGPTRGHRYNSTRDGPYGKTII